MAYQDQLDTIVKELDFVVRLYPEGNRTRRFDTFTDLQGFLDNEIQHWEGGSSLPFPPKLREARKGLSEATAQDVHNARQSLQRVRDQLNDSQIVYSSTAEGTFLRKLFETNPGEVRGAYEFLHGGITTPGVPEVLAGAIRGFLFKCPELAQTHRIDAELASFAKLRATVEAAHDKLLHDYDDFRKAVDDWRTTSHQSLETTVTKGNTQLSKTNQVWEKRFEELQTSAQTQIESIQKAYGEQMSLKEPARYWGRLETDYRRQGLVAAGIAFAIAILFAAAVAWLLYHPPELWKEDWISAATVKGTLVLAIGISTVLYLLHLVVRLAVSSLHLSRDACERQNLTHVFLALLKEGKIELKEREIVYSALFSRSDSGLLKHDGGPSMAGPSGWLSDLFKGGR